MIRDNHSFIMLINKRWHLTHALLALIGSLCALPSHAQQHTQHAKAPSQTCVSLQALHHGKQATVVYLWSPRMVGAVLEAAHARLAATQSGAAFVPVLDPRVDTTQALAALQRNAAAKQALRATHIVCAESLPEHALDHMPTMLVLRHGKLHPHRIIGIMPREAWRSAIESRLDDLNHPSLAAFSAHGEPVKP